MVLDTPNIQNGTRRKSSGFDLDRIKVGTGNSLHYILVDLSRSSMQDTKVHPKKAGMEIRHEIKQF